MKHDEVQARVLRVAQYIITHKATVRQAANQFKVSKSAIHLDMIGRLHYLDPELYYQVRAVLDHNKSTRHIRGGEATRIKYKGEHQDDYY